MATPYHSQCSQVKEYNLFQCTFLTKCIQIWNISPFLIRPRKANWGTFPPGEGIAHCAAKRSFTAKTIPGGSGKQRFPMRRTRIRGGPCPSAGLRNQPENMKKWRCPGLNARGTLSYLGRKAAKRFSGKNRLRFSPRRKPGRPRPRPWPRRDPLWDRRRRG